MGGLSKRSEAGYQSIGLASLTTFTSTETQAEEAVEKDMVWDVEIGSGGDLTGSCVDGGSLTPAAVPYI